MLHSFHQLQFPWSVLLLQDTVVPMSRNKADRNENESDLDFVFLCCFFIAGCNIYSHVFLCITCDLVLHSFERASLKLNKSIWYQVAAAWSIKRQIDDHLYTLTLSHFPFLIHSVQLVVVLNPNSHTSQLSPVHPAAHTSQLSPVHPIVHTSQLDPAHPVRHLLHSPAGPKLISHMLQFCPVHPRAHSLQLLPANPVARESQFSTVHLWAQESQFLPAHPV